MIKIQENIDYNVCVDYLKRQMERSQKKEQLKKVEQFADDRNPDGEEDDDIHIFA